MVMTPWGDSEKLRQRRLRPGPGSDPAEVDQNQRERLFGAMIAEVAEKGYEATTLPRLAQVSGVSTRTLYELFRGKEDCFGQMLQTVVSLAAGLVTQIGNDPELGGWEERARAGSQAMAEMVVAQPAAARVVLVEAFAAGPRVTAPLETAIAEFEVLVQQIAAQSPERAGMPAEMIRAYTGGIEEILRMRLLASTEGELPTLIDELWDLFESYQPPPGRLRLTGRAPAIGVETVEGHDTTERAIRALALEAAARGYRETTIADVLARARMSATTLYDVIAGKGELMAAAIDSAGAQMAAAMIPPARRAPDWPSAVRAALGALFNFFTSRPALARLVLVEAYVAGPFALECRAGHLAPLAELLEKGHERTPEAPPIATELVAGVFYSLSRKTILESGVGGLPDLAPLCAYLALAPYVGPEEALAVANGAGHRRGG